MTEEIKKIQPKQTKKPTHPSLAAALAAVQAEIQSVQKDAVVKSSFTFSYVTYATLAESLFPVLAKHGVAYSCSCDYKDDTTVVVGMLLHADSSDVLTAGLHLPKPKTVQELGSFLTYARRYLLMLLTGIGQDEDPDVQKQELSYQAKRQPVPQQNDEVDAVLATIWSIQDVDELRDYYKSLPFDVQGSRRVAGAVRKRKEQLDEKEVKHESN